MKAILILALVLAGGQLAVAKDKPKADKTDRKPASSGDFFCGSVFGRQDAIAKTIAENCNTNKPFSFSADGGGGGASVLYCCTAR